MKLRLTLLSLLLLFASFGNAQKAKVKIKDEIATVDGVAYLKWTKINALEVSISGANSIDNNEISAMWKNYTDPNKITDANPEGKVRWIELYFVNLDLRCEVSSQTQKGLVRTIKQHDLYTDGQLNEENVQKMVKKYGMRISVNRPGGNVNVIINN